MMAFLIDEEVFSREPENFLQFFALTSIIISLGMHLLSPQLDCIGRYLCYFKFKRIEIVILCGGIFSIHDE